MLLFFLMLHACFFFLFCPLLLKSVLLLLVLLFLLAAIVFSPFLAKESKPALLLLWLFFNLRGFWLLIHNNRFWRMCFNILLRLWGNKYADGAARWLEWRFGQWWCWHLLFFFRLMR